MQRLIFATLTALAAAQTFEAPDFNATEALAGIGIDITAVPDLTSLAQESFNLTKRAAMACSVAVSRVP